jgi:hypothetical protein
MKQLTRTEAWLSLRLGIAKSLRYPLTATTLSQKDCKELHRPLLQVAFKALGLPSKFPYTIAFAPPAILGLGFPNHLWHDQGIDHLTALLKHGDGPPDHKTPNVTGCLHWDTLANLWVKLGLPGSPFQHKVQKTSSVHYKNLAPHDMAVLQRVPVGSAGRAPTATPETQVRPIYYASILGSRLLGQGIETPQSVPPMVPSYIIRHHHRRRPTLTTQILGSERQNNEKSRQMAATRHTR